MHMNQFTTGSSLSDWLIRVTAALSSPSVTMTWQSYRSPEAGQKGDKLFLILMKGWANFLVLGQHRLDHEQRKVISFETGHFAVPNLAFLSSGKYKT